jgi:hypothetical protein
MKLGLQNYTVIIPTDKSYIKFNNNKLNSLQTYDIAQSYRILYKEVQLFSQRNLKMSNTNVFKSSIKENNDSNKTFRYVRDLSMNKNFIFLSVTVHECPP